MISRHIAFWVISSPSRLLCVQPLLCSFKIIQIPSISSYIQSIRNTVYMLSSAARVAKGCVCVGGGLCRRGSGYVIKYMHIYSPTRAQHKPRLHYNNTYRGLLATNDVNMEIILPRGKRLSFVFYNSSACLAKTVSTDVQLHNCTLHVFFPFSFFHWR